MTQTCVRCGQPTPDGYACARCGIDRPRAQLAEIAELVVAARDVAHRQTRRGGAGAASGKPGSTLPIDLGAQSRLDAAQTALTTWARHIEAERGMIVAPAQINGGGQTGSPEGVGMGRTGVGDLSGLAIGLREHCEWMRHRDKVPEFLADVDRCARLLRAVIDGPGEKRYLGHCGAPVDPDTGAYADDDQDDAVPCEGDVYARPGAKMGTCRSCGAGWDNIADRRDQLVQQVRAADQAYPARDLAHALDVPVKTIRTWATEIRSDTGAVIRPAKLRTWYRLGEHVVPWTEPAEGEDVKARGPRLHYASDVMDLRRQAEERRAARARHVDNSAG